MAQARDIESLAHAALQGDRIRARTYVEVLLANESRPDGRLATQLARLLRQHPKAVQLGGAVNGLLAQIEPRQGINDLVLDHNTREVLEALITEQRSTELLRANDLEPRHTLLLIGPPGNGKTTVAGAIAKRLDVPFYSLAYQGVIQSHLGETTGKLAKALDHVAGHPCVLLIDEVEIVAKERNDSQEVGEMKRITASLLMALDALPTHTVVVGATNHAEMLDRASWRRFELRLELGPPGSALCEAYLLPWLKRWDATAHPADRLGINLAELTDRLTGRSYAEIEQWCLACTRSLVLAGDKAKLPTIITAELEHIESRPELQRLKTAQPSTTNRSKEV